MVSTEASSISLEKYNSIRVGERTSIFESWATLLSSTVVFGFKELSPISAKPVVFKVKLVIDLAGKN